MSEVYAVWYSLISGNDHHLYSSIMIIMIVIKCDAIGNWTNDRENNIKIRERNGDNKLCCMSYNWFYNTF